MAFEDLARLPLVAFYESSFRKATGVTLKVVPPDAGGHRPAAQGTENLFCAILASTPTTCGPCQQTEERACRNAANKRTTQQLYCHAGMTVLAVPVILDTRHIATLLSGQIFRREPTERDFNLILKSFDGDLPPDWVKKLRKAYFDTPVLTAERFQAAVQLVEVFAQYLSDSANRLAIAGSDEDPEVVARAKEFVRTHAEETITLTQVVQHVHVSRFYFCKLFKKATGVTLTEYITRVRIEKAKTLLNDRSRRISEVVFASGFGSVPQFNSVFKRHVGLAPTEYRATLLSQLPVPTLKPQRLMGA